MERHRNHLRRNKVGSTYGGLHQVVPEAQGKDHKLPMSL